MELENETIFDIGIDKINFNTKCNGDRIKIQDPTISKESAATLTYLINKGVILEVQIKEKGT